MVEARQQLYLILAEAGVAPSAAQDAEEEFDEDTDAES
jgi:hypothetical protein